MGAGNIFLDVANLSTFNNPFNLTSVFVRNVPRLI